MIGYSGDNFTGTSWTFTADNPDLRVTGNNDQITSLKVQFNPATYFRITNVTNGLALDSGGNVASGSNLKQWTWDGSTNLQWQAVDVGNGYYRLVNRTNGMVADGWGATGNGSAGPAGGLERRHQPAVEDHPPRRRPLLDRQPHHRPGPRRRRQRRLGLRHQAVDLRQQHQPAVDLHRAVAGGAR